MLQFFVRGYHTRSTDCAHPHCDFSLPKHLTTFSKNQHPLKPPIASTNNSPRQSLQNLTFFSYNPYHRQIKELIRLQQACDLTSRPKTLGNVTGALGCRTDAHCNARWYCHNCNTEDHLTSKPNLTHTSRPRFHQQFSSPHPPKTTSFSCQPKPDQTTNFTYNFLISRPRLWALDSCTDHKSTLQCKVVQSQLQYGEQEL